MTAIILLLILATLLFGSTAVLGAIGIVLGLAASFVATLIGVIVLSQSFAVTPESVIIYGVGVVFASAIVLAVIVSGLTTLRSYRKTAIKNAEQQLEIAKQALIEVDRAKAEQERKAELEELRAYFRKPAPGRAKNRRQRPELNE